MSERRARAEKMRCAYTTTDTDGSHRGESPCLELLCLCAGAVSPPPQLNCAAVRRETPWPGDCLELMELLLRATFTFVYSRVVVGDMHHKLSGIESRARNEKNESQ
jgi:hypothetical protein